MTECAAQQLTPKEAEVLPGFCLISSTSFDAHKGDSEQLCQLCALRTIKIFNSCKYTFISKLLLLGLIIFKDSERYTNLRE